MLSKTMETALNKQINREFYSEFLYLSMAGYFETLFLKEFAKWMRVQAKKEHAHAVKIYKFVLVRGGRVTLETIEAPKAKWTSPGKVFEESYAHEQKVTGYINSLIDPATKENDHATFEFMQWFFKKSGGRGKCTRHPLPDHNCQRYHRASLLP